MHLVLNCVLKKFWWLYFISIFASPNTKGLVNPNSIFEKDLILIAQIQIQIMTHYPLKRLFRLGALCAVAVPLLSSCIDDSYDLDNVDLTMGLGSDGLSVKLGNTEKILLKDILDVDESVKLDEANLYYLVEDGSTNFNIEVDNVDVTFENAYINSSRRVLDFDFMCESAGKDPSSGSVTIAAGRSEEGEAEGSSTFDMSVDEIGDEIKRISGITVEEVPVRMYLEVENSANMHFDITYIDNFTVEIPEFVVIDRVSEGWTVDGQNLVYNGRLSIPEDGMICEVFCKEVDLAEDGVPVDGTITIAPERTEIKMNGNVGFHTTQSSTMGPDDYTDVRLRLIVGDGSGKLNIQSATGIFDPTINPDVESINIVSSLPDFLQDDEVRIDIANPTLKFTSDLTQIPVGVNLSADLISVKEGANGFEKTVALPSLRLENGQTNTLYYYQGSAPYDPEADAATVQTASAQVSNLSTLIQQLPDRIDVELSDRRITVQDEEYTIELGRTYSAKAEYKVYAPFEFSEGLTIVYRDSTESVNEDLQDYAAEGARITATAENTIPLNLVVYVEARDVDGQPVDGVTFNTATIAAGNDASTEPVTTEVTVDADLANPTDLKKIDSFFFRIEAAAGESTQSHKLLSDQYVRLTDVRIRLKGQVTADFN